VKIFITAIVLGTVAIVANTELVNGQSLIFPPDGKSREQQTLDLRECNTQAREETDFDPAKPLKRKDGQVDPQQQRRRQEQLQAYKQILNTCLQQRGYTLR